MSACAAKSTRAFYTSRGWCSPTGLQSTFLVYCTTAENNSHSNMLCRSMAEQWAVYKGKNTVTKQKLAGGKRARQASSALGGEPEKHADSQFWATDIWAVLLQSKQKQDKSRQVDTKLTVWSRCFRISYSSTCEFTQTEVQLPIISLVWFLSRLDKTLRADLSKILSVKNYHPLPKVRSVSYEIVPSQMVWGCISEGILDSQAARFQQARTNPSIFPSNIKSLGCHRDNSVNTQLG